MKNKSLWECVALIVCVVVILISSYLIITTPDTFGDSFDDYYILEDMWYDQRDINKSTVQFNLWSWNHSLSGKHYSLVIQYKENGSWSDPVAHEITFGYSISGEERINHFSSIPKVWNETDNMTFWLGKNSIASDTFWFEFNGYLYGLSENTDEVDIGFGGTFTHFYRWTVTNAVEE